jgi:hypothetical protein
MIRKHATIEVIKNAGKANEGTLTLRTYKIKNTADSAM